MELESINTVAAAFVAGCVTSVHCVGMCGPLACAVTAGTGGRAGVGRCASPQLSSTLYHAGRMMSYTAVGALAGAVGRAPLAFFKDSPVALLPWVLVAVFLLVALGLDKKFPRPAFAGRALTAMRLRLSGARWAPPALALGVGTPLLPCGPLYLMFGVALVTGSALRGAEFCLAFGLGTVPLLWLAQSQFGFLQRRLGPRGLWRVQRGCAFAAAMVLAWRLRVTLWFVEGGAPWCH